MTAGQDMRKDCEARLRALVRDDERVVAVGTADELPQASGDLSSSGSWRFLVVTTERLLFADWSKPDQPHEQIAFDEVDRWADGTQYHRYVITLNHPAISREERVPAHRLLWLEWGNTFEARSRTQTTLRFSHRDTDAGSALRAALKERKIPHEPLMLPEVSREERTRGSHAELRPK